MFENYALAFSFKQDVTNIRRDLEKINNIKKEYYSKVQVLDGILKQEYFDPSFKIKKLFEL